MGNDGIRTYLVVLGTRPNFVKAAPFLQRAKEHANLRFDLLHTGQHFDDNMSRVFFDEMSIPRPDIHLDIKGQFHTEKIGKTFSALKEVMQSSVYDGIVLFGDVNSTLAGAVAAASTGNRIIHVEAGLRSHDRRMPEEINRVIVDHMSDLLFATEPSAINNLATEGVSSEKVVHVGNIMIESIERYRPQILKSDVLEQLSLIERKYLIATVHRSENTDNPHILERILHILDLLAERQQIVLPLHPGTKRKIHDYNLQSKLNRLHVVEPLGYLEFLKLVISCRGVVTDSGGIQEETTHEGIPCVTLRDNTERPITLDLGSNKLFPVEDLGIDSINDIEEHIYSSTFSKAPIPLWDDGVSARILAHL